MSQNKEIRESVEAELAFDPLVDASDIRLTNVMGDVALNGTVPSYPEYVAAATAARRVAGVTKVHNHLEVVLPPSNFRDDAMLTTAANNALGATVTVPAGVEATAKDGDVTLYGSVRFGNQRRAATNAVSGLFGVRNVVDDIEVLSPADPTEVTAQVQRALDRHALVLDDSDIQVGADYGTVTLAGHVRTWAEHDAVISAAWMTDGVSGLRDDLVVTG
jgi:osmotically-inducible protein OsmY